MARDIQLSLHGRRFGIGADDELIINRRNGEQEFFGLAATVGVTSAELLALNATPKTLIAAPGAGLAIIPRRIAIRHAGGTAYAGIAGGEDLVLKYTDGSGAQCSSVIEATGFLDQTAAQIRVAHQPGSMTTVAGDYAPVANAAVVLSLLSGEITTGNFPLIVKVWYDIISTAFVVG